MKTYARIVFANIMMVSLLLTAAGQEISVVINTSGTWMSGKWTPVSVDISGTTGTGPCRFRQNWPDGFEVRPVNSEGGNFFVQDNSVNITWAVMPQGNAVSVSYEVKPHQSFSGTVEPDGVLYHISNSNVRGTVVLPECRIEVADGIAGADQSTVAPATRNPETMVVFRVQVLSSSTRLSDQELRGRLGVTFNEKVTVVREGTIYKYQVGECPSLECARHLNKILIEGGVEGSFVVAFTGETQITVEKALMLLR